MTYPGQRPDDFPVTGHGLARLKSFIALALRWMRPLLSRGQVSQRGDANADKDAASSAAMMAADGMCRLLFAIIALR